MTKIELVKMVAEKTGIDQPTALAAVEGVIDTLKESLINKENVDISAYPNGNFDALIDFIQNLNL